MRLLVFLFISVFNGVLVSSGANAALIKIEYSGFVNDITEYRGTISGSTRGNYNWHNGAFSLGQEVRGEYLYDTGVQPGPTLLSDPNRNIYRAVLNSEISFGALTYDLGGWPYSYSPRGTAQVWNNYNNTDLLSFTSPLFYTQPVDLGLGQEIASATMHLHDRTMEALSNIMLPTSISLSEFSSYGNVNFLQMTGTGQNVERRFLFVRTKLTSLKTSLYSPINVSSPPSIILFLLGLMLLFGISKRMKRVM